MHGNKRNKFEMGQRVNSHFIFSFSSWHLQKKIKIKIKALAQSINLEITGVDSTSRQDIRYATSNE